MTDAQEPNLGNSVRPEGTATGPAQSARRIRTLPDEAYPHPKLTFFRSAC